MYKSFSEWIQNKSHINENTKISQILVEASTYAQSRYSIEVNYRTSLDEVKNEFARISLGYVMAALKKNDYNVKHVYDAEPYRIIVSSGGFSDNKYVIVVTFNKGINKFVYAKGFYRKNRDSVEVTSAAVTSTAESASELTRELLNQLHTMKKEEPHVSPMNLKPIKGKRGPKGMAL